MSSEIKATNYKAKDGTAGLVITDYSGDVKSTAKFGVRKTAVASLDVKSNADNANDGGISIEANSNTNRLFQLGETTGQTAIQQMYTGNTEKTKVTRCEQTTPITQVNIPISTILNIANSSLTLFKATVA